MTLTYVEPLSFSQLPNSGTYNGKTDGFYGYALKNGVKKPILHSKIKSLLDNLCHADFLFI
jgi:hypothetical protein